MNVSSTSSVVSPMAWVTCPDNATCGGHRIHDGSARGWHCSNSDCRYATAENSLVVMPMMILIFVPTAIDFNQSMMAYGQTKKTDQKTRPLGPKCGNCSTRPRCRKDNKAAEKCNGGS